jgi:thioredoxin reductase (NADPH)
VVLRETEVVKWQRSLATMRRFSAHYLMKPWEPAEDRLYPVLDDLLEHWFGGHHPQFEGIRVIGQKWSPQAHRVKYFLARHQIPYKWLGFETDAEARTLVEHAGQGGQLPLVLFPDGSHFFDPTLRQIGEKLGLKTRPQMPHYDLVIIGAGPAGLAGAVSGASEGLKTVMIERFAPVVRRVQVRASRIISVSRRV